MSLKNFQSSDKHRRIHKDFKKVLTRYAKDLTAMEMLAIASHLVGTLIALQDKTKVTPAEAIELVQQNIQAGNDEAVQAAVAKGETPVYGENDNG